MQSSGDSGASTNVYLVLVLVTCSDMQGWNRAPGTESGSAYLASDRKTANDKYVLGVDDS